MTQERREIPDFEFLDLAFHVDGFGQTAEHLGGPCEKPARNIAFFDKGRPSRIRVRATLKPKLWGQGWVEANESACPLNGIPPGGGNLGLTDVGERCLVLPFDTAGIGENAIALRRVTFQALAVKQELAGFLDFTLLDQDAGIDAVFFGRSRLDKQRNGTFCVAFCDQAQCGGDSVGRGMIESCRGAEGLRADDILVSQR